MRNEIVAVTSFLKSLLCVVDEYCFSSVNIRTSFFSIAFKQENKMPGWFGCLALEEVQAY